MHAMPHNVCKRKLAPRMGRPPVKVDSSAVRALFGIPQPSAAKTLGISLTSLKQLCRKMGVARWPYRRGRDFDRRFADSESSSNSNSTGSVSLDDMNLELSDTDYSLSRASSADSDAPTVSDVGVSRSLGLPLYEPSSLTMQGDHFGCTRHMLQEHGCDKDTVFLVEEDDSSDADWLFEIGGEWADLYAREATHQLDDCIHAQE